MKIDINNYEEWMIDYVEGNLSPVQQKEFAGFLESHPELQADLELFRQTKLQPDMNIVFEGKEVLMQKESGRVIVMGNRVKYAAAVAAVVMIFIGVRNYNSEPDQLSIKQYNANDIGENYAYDRETDRVINETLENKESESVDHNFAELEENNVPEIKEKKDEIQLRPEIEIRRDQNLAVTGVDYAEVKSFEIRIENAIDYQPVSNVAEPMYALNNQTDNSKYISLNDNTSITDWMSDALAVGGEVGGLLESFILKDEKPEEEVSDSPYKTTTVNIFGISYYSRKKSN